MKQGIKNYLAITKKEWNGLVVLVILIALTVAAPYVYQLLRKDNTINNKDFDKAIAMLSKTSDSTRANSSGTGSHGTSPQVVMFRFNPNNLTLQKWAQLGLTEKQAAVIKHYEAKGGRFYSKDDLKKVYTISDSDFKRLEPYIEIPKGNGANKLTVDKIIEINSADSAKLIKVPGVWPALAKRIFRYKERLGGFIDKQQLKEVYGVDSLKFVEIEPAISINPALVKKININTVSFAQFQLFPYLTYKQKNAVIEYRNQHGNYTSMADFKNIAILDEVILRKIEPYLAFK
jgi:DNA uptake protein ComE-like DNA-binding protein